MLWVALWGGGSVVRLDSRGNEIARLRVPVPQVSSVAFGGADLSELYITTAGGDDRARYGPLAGSLFRARPGVRGLSPNRSALLEPVPNAKPSWPPPSSCSVAGETRDMPPRPAPVRAPACSRALNAGALPRFLRSLRLTSCGVETDTTLSAGVHGIRHSGTLAACIPPLHRTCSSPL